MLILVPTAREARSLFDGAAPSDERPVRAMVGGREVEAALCGFGCAAAGVLAARALGATRPGRCVLAGIAGTYDQARLPVGGLLRVTEVRMADIGRGRGASFRPAGEMGHPQAPPGDGVEAVGDVIRLGPSGLGGAEAREGALLTVAAASDCVAEASVRAATHPEALAEDMEGFSVALAARRAGVPLAILRGISNEVGLGDAVDWDVRGALARVRAALVGAVGP